MGSDSINSLNINQVSKFLNNYYQGIKASPEKPSTETQLPKMEVDELTSDILVSMQIFIVEARRKDFYSNDIILNEVFLSGNNLEELAKKFSNMEIDKDERELILARFAMKFLFDKILDKNDTKMQEVIRIINAHPELKEALSQVLAGVDDNNQAITRFNEVFKIKVKENEQPDETKSVSITKENIVDSGSRNNDYWTPVKEVQKSQAKANKSAKEAFSAFNQAAGIHLDTDSIAQLQENRSILSEVVISAQEYNSALEEISENVTKFDHEYGMRPSDLSYRVLSRLDYVIQINGLAGYYVNNQLLGSMTFTEQEVAFYGNPEQYAFSKAVEAFVKEGMSREEATVKVKELIEIRLVAEWLLKVKEQVKSRKHDVDEVKDKAEEQINLINQQIKFLDARVQAKHSLQETFNKIDFSITNFFDKDNAMTAAKLMVEAMSFCQSQDYRNLLVISSILDEKMMASFEKFKQELQQTSINQKVIRAIDVVLTVNKKDMFNKQNTVLVA